MVIGINVFNAQKTETLSEIALANVEALAASDDTSVHSCVSQGIYCSLKLDGNIIFESREHHFEFPI